MPKPTLPPTPASSTDIEAKTGEPALETDFELPSPAIANSTLSSNAFDSSYRPPPPSRKRARVEVGFTLPPPPSRTRKIIQMKPGTEGKDAARGKKKAGAAKQATAAGKRMARKTAHSTIERRRRSKMNQEFETLKEMVPACKGQSMHKLAILQAGIDYMTYLEQCITDLKEAKGMAAASTSEVPTPRQGSNSPIVDSDGDSTDFEEVDPVPVNTPRSSFSGNLPPLASPALQAQPASENHRGLDLQSPVREQFGLQRPYFSHQSSAAASPTLLPNRMQEAEHEASATLLMLNSDRRQSRNGERRGLGVMDLLST